MTIRRNSARSTSGEVESVVTSASGPSEAVFARHETFAPRAGWLKKGFDAAMENESVFLHEDAPVVLGVGKNMARAIRYWTHAFGLLADVPLPGTRAFGSRPTRLGLDLLGPGGWDPYLEDAASLWYLHWCLVQRPAAATSWYYAFSCFPEREFTVEQLSAGLREHVRKTYPVARAADSSLHKDVLCLVRMYGEAPPRGALTEDTIRCPFAELGLLRPGAEPKTYAFDIGEKPDLPAAVIVAACLEFATAVAPDARTIGLGRLLYEPGSPGLAFKLTEGALATAVEEVASATRAITLADTAGLVQLAFQGAPRALGRQLLRGHYRATVGVEGAR